MIATQVEALQRAKGRQSRNIGEITIATQVEALQLAKGRQR